MNYSNIHQEWISVEIKLIGEKITVLLNNTPLIAGLAEPDEPKIKDVIGT